MDQTNNMKQMNDADLNIVTGGQSVIQENNMNDTKSEQKTEEIVTAQNDKWHRPLISVNRDFKK